MPENFKYRNKSMFAICDVFVCCNSHSIKHAGDSVRCLVPSCVLILQFVMLHKNAPKAYFGLRLIQGFLIFFSVHIFLSSWFIRALQSQSLTVSYNDVVRCSMVYWYMSEAPRRYVDAFSISYKILRESGETKL